jgi:hypothetical protein
MKERKQNFIRKIQIKNYKSIKDLTVVFKKILGTFKFGGIG